MIFWLYEKKKISPSMYAMFGLSTVVSFNKPILFYLLHLEWKRLVVLNAFKQHENNCLSSMLDT